MSTFQEASIFVAIYDTIIFGGRVHPQNVIAWLLGQMNNGPRDSLFSNNELSALVGVLETNNPEQFKS